MNRQSLGRSKNTPKKGVVAGGVGADGGGGGGGSGSGADASAEGRGDIGDPTAATSGGVGGAVVGNASVDQFPIIHNGDLEEEGETHERVY
jgi:hypothetical protein